MAPVLNAVEDLGFSRALRTLRGGATAVLAGAGTGRALFGGRVQEELRLALLTGLHRTISTIRHQTVRRRLTVVHLHTSLLILINLAPTIDFPTPSKSSELVPGFADRAVVVSTCAFFAAHGARQALLARGVRGGGLCDVEAVFADVAVGDPVDDLTLPSNTVVDITLSGRLFAHLLVRIQEISSFTGRALRVAHALRAPVRARLAFARDLVAPLAIWACLRTLSILKEEVLCAFRARGCEDCARQGLEFALQARVRGGV